MNHEVFEPDLGGVPERMISEGIKVHGNTLARVGDTVESVRNVMNIIPKGTQAKVIGIKIEPGADRGGRFLKSMKIAGYEGYYNPQRFKKI